MMKKYIFIILFVFIAMNISAQKEVRKAVRSGNKAYNEQLYATAETEYNKAIKENASSKEASYNLANTYYKQQKWDEALKEYQHYLTLENQDPAKMSAAWSNMGNTFLKKKANEKAQGAAAQMMQSPGGQQAAAPQQGGQQADNLKMSMEAYKNALRLNPTDNDTRYNLAVVQKMIKDKEDQDQDQKQDKQDQKQDKQDQKQDPKEDPKKDQNKDPKQDQQNKQDQQQMSQDNIQQILQAIEQDEKETQERVKQAKAQERKKQQDQNRKQSKDW